MIRITRGAVAHKRRKKYLTLAKGYTGSNSRLSTMAGEQIVQSLNFAYISRRLKKRTFRRIWISRLNTTLRLKQTKYSKFIGQLKKNNIYLDRRILAFLAFNDISTFYSLENLLK
jgi:large subunit ribosomal protein L20